MTDSTHDTIDATARGGAVAARDVPAPPASADPVVIDYEVLDGGARIATVWLNRADKLNGLTMDAIRGLSRAAEELSRDRDLRGVIIAGAGRSFSAGLDFASAFKTGPMTIAANFIPGADGLNLFQRSCGAWRSVPVPVVAVVQGHCFGAGLQLALGADFRVTVADATWSVMETKWGLIPDMSGVRPLIDAVGPDRAKWLAMSGELLPGERAAELGLATACADSLADAHAHARGLLAELATRSPDQLAASKRLFNDSTRSPRKALRAERIEQALLFLRENTTRARKAGMKKVAPAFTRRGTWGFGPKK